MNFFIFTKDSDGIEGTLYKICENQFDLDSLNIQKDSYKIIEDSQFNFNLLKHGNKFPIKYNNNIITYVDQTFLFMNKEQLKIYVDNFKNQIKQFTDNNPNHSSFSLWNNYYNQLNNLNLDNITYPLNKSLEQYFSDLSQPSLNPLQIP